MSGRFGSGKPPVRAVSDTSDAFIRRDHAAIHASAMPRSLARQSVAICC